MIRIVLKLSLMVVTVCVIGWLYLFAGSVRESQRARSFLNEIRPLKVGSTTLEEARPLLARYAAENLPPSDLSGICPVADTGYVIQFRAKLTLPFAMRFPFLRYVGLVPWGAASDIYFQNGRLCALRYSVGTTRYAQYHVLETFDIRTIESSSAADDYDLGGGGNTLHRIHGVGLPLNPSPQERAHAFAFNLSCVTQFGGCRTPCEVLPLKPIWDDYDARNSQVVIPPGVLSDPFCTPK
jgi:hypothetical protein